MSKGPGRVSRAVETALEAEPDSAFTVEDLCDRVYRGINQVEKKHRVSVLRAAKAIVARRPELVWMKSEGLGGTLVVFNRYQVLSYAMARLKTDNFNRYRSNDKRDEWSPSAWFCRARGLPSPGNCKVWVVKNITRMRHSCVPGSAREGPITGSSLLAAHGGATCRCTSPNVTVTRRG